MNLNKIFVAFPFPKGSLAQHWSDFMSHTHLLWQKWIKSFKPSFNWVKADWPLYKAHQRQLCVLYQNLLQLHSHYLNMCHARPTFVNITTLPEMHFFCTSHHHNFKRQVRKKTRIPATKYHYDKPVSCKKSPVEAFFNKRNFQSNFPLQVSLGLTSKWAQPCRDINRLRI